MAKPLTSEDLIKSIKRRAFIPEDQRTYEEDDFLEMINEEINVFGIPQLLSTYEEYLVKFEDDELISDVFSYQIPYRAIGNKLREVSIIDGSDNTYEMSRINIDDLFDYKKGYTNNGGYVFYLEDNNIKFVNEVPVSQGKVRKYFYLQPNTLVSSKQVGKIINIDRTSGIITMSNFPDEFSNLPLFDFVGHNSPNKIYDYDVSSVSVNKNTKSITFAVDSIPKNLIVGDYVCKKQETPVPQLPLELHPILAQRVAIACLEGLGDTEGAQVASNKLIKMEESIIPIINNRVEGAPQKINNRHSPLSQNRSNGGNKKGII